jgi:predicted metal-dependent HD superfamily phosphohydrolase
MAYSTSPGGNGLGIGGVWYRFRRAISPTRGRTEEGPMPTDDEKSELLARWNTNLPQQQELGENLITRYSEPHRRYHTTKHLLHVLTMIDQLADDHDIFLVRLAAWFHDAVYAIPAGQVSNEEASARLALRELSRVGLEQEDLNQIARLVRLTETHVPGPRDPEGELLCDADLAILASDPSDYADYVAAVREEYAQLPEEGFLAGRLAVLTELADREIFRTAKGRQLTDAARVNLTAELAAVRERLGIAVEGSEM